MESSGRICRRIYDFLTPVDTFCHNWVTNLRCWDCNFLFVCRHTDIKVWLSQELIDTTEGLVVAKCIIIGVHETRCFIWQTIELTGVNSLTNTSCWACLTLFVFWVPKLGRQACQAQISLLVYVSRLADASSTSESKGWIPTACAFGQRGTLFTALRTRNTFRILTKVSIITSIFFAFYVVYLLEWSIWRFQT